VQPGTDSDASPGYPATYVSPAIICVEATDKNDTMASFSNYEAAPVDLAAPGVNISSTTP
jgi:subtilisin family serine protease